MRCSCPHMGNYHLAFKALFRTAGIDFISAPPITKRTLELGVRYSPEFVCLPFKINLGNLIEALEEGADVLFQSGGKGACRYGAYLDMQETILKEAGFNNFHIYRLFDTSNISASWHQLKRLQPSLSALRLLKAVRIAYAKIKAIDRIENLIRRETPYVSDKFELERIYKESLQDIDRVNSPHQLNRLVKDFSNKLNQIKKDLNTKPLKVGVVGELYVVMEPYSNLELEKQLGDLGVEVLRPLNLSHMLKEFFFLGLPRRHYLKIARPYLKHDCCAHANVSVAETIIFAQRNLDGVIHIKPHACMPELTAMSALFRVSRDHNIPILFFSFDEHTTSVGVNTRLEAFVELLKRRRAKCT